MHTRRLLVLFMLVAGIAPHVGTAADRNVEALGQAIVRAQCGGCHAIGKTGPSPLANAPPFRDLHLKYDVAYLAESLAEGITTGHPGMPTFVFLPPEIDAIIAYLKSLETDENRKWK